MYSTFDTKMNGKVDELQKEINQWKEGMEDDEMFRKIFRGFKTLCKNFEEER
jgi:hypothetical protein